MEVHGLLRQAHLDGEGGGEVPEGGALVGPLVGPWAAVEGAWKHIHFGAQVETLAEAQVFDYKGTIELSLHIQGPSGIKVLSGLPLTDCIV